MIYIGNDIVEVERIKQSILKYNDKFINKIFTLKEIDFCKKKTNPFIHFAGRFAGKEAVKKILLQINKNPIPLKNIEIQRNEDSPPQVFINNKYENGLQVSISHTENYATAVAILEKK